jgi:hypothetical protein
MVSGFLPFNIEIFEGLELWSVVFSQYSGLLHQ